MVTTAVTEQVQLVNGKFKPLDASDFLKKLIAESINAHKIERLKLLIGNENTDTDWLDNNIKYLAYEEKQLRAIIDEAQRAGKKVNINAKLDITIE